jgi:hypothetical protein
MSNCLLPPLLGGGDFFLNLLALSLTPLITLLYIEIDNNHF